MAILITGGKGFVGSSLVSFLKKENRDVILFEGDISDKKHIENFSTNKTIEAVVHLAAVVNSKNKKVFERVNVEGTKNIVSLCRKVNAKRILFLSTVRVLSQSSDPYSASKRKAEGIVIGSGLPYVIIRPSMVYGPGDNKNIGFLLKIAKSLPVMPVLNFKIQPIFVDDLVRAISSCLKAHTNSTFNITGVEKISFYDLLKKLKSLGYKFKIVNMPRLFSFAIKMFSLFSFSPLPYWQVNGLLKDEIFRGDNWPELFDIKPTPLSDGLAKIVKKV